MSSQGDGKLYKRDAYITGDKPKTEKKEHDHVQLYLLKHKEYSKMLGHPAYYNYSDSCWTSNADKATRFEGVDDSRIPEYGTENFEFVEVER